ncbi:MAG: GNAT family N-acetyltransferase [Emcibacter sp.]|nr:GNAT family N-acetyltransferase [Emcibacter sp.]
MNEYVLSPIEPAHINDLKQAYLQQLTRPLDGMWECFVEAADHYAIVRNGTIIGYFVINSEHKILQFYVEHTYDARPIFKQMLSETRASGAHLATCEIEYLSLCWDHQTSVTTHTLMYHVEEETEIEEGVFPPQAHFRNIELSELDIVVDFGATTLGADSSWLTGYFSELINQGEIFGLWIDNQLVATGECRVSKTQKPYADLGMIVSKDYRRQGLATNILRSLVHRCQTMGLCAICSTEKDNVAAQKAIEKAGFISQNTILEISL